MEVVPTFLLVHITLVKEAKVEVLGAGGRGGEKTSSGFDDFFEHGPKKKSWLLVLSSHGELGL